MTPNRLSGMTQSAQSLFQTRLLSGMYQKTQKLPFVTSAPSLFQDRRQPEGNAWEHVDQYEGTGDRKNKRHNSSNNQPKRYACDRCRYKKSHPYRGRNHSGNKIDAHDHGKMNRIKAYSHGYRSQNRTKQQYRSRSFHEHSHKEQQNIDT